MSTIPPAIQDLARRLVASAMVDVGSSDDAALPAVRACERLRPTLTKLVGIEGFASLLSRALALAKRQDSSLAGLRVGDDGALSGQPDRRPEPGASAAPGDGGVALMAELLGLLVTFIGQPLTLSLVRDAWGDVTPGATPPTTEEPL
jgi:hypothetical protein